MVHIQENIGNLCSRLGKSPVAHCVSRDLVMGAGVALAIKRVVGAHRTSELRTQDPKIGELVHLLYMDQPVF